MISAGLGQTQMVDMLLTAGADVHALDDTMGASALHKVPVFFLITLRLGCAKWQCGCYSTAFE